MVELGPPPRYGEASLADLVPSILARHGVGEHGDTLGIPEARAHIVLVVDGLGWRQLGQTDAASFLTAAGGRSIDTVLPSTTVASLGSLGTGRPPGDHGLLGYTVPWPGESQPFNPLVWRVGLQSGGREVIEEIVPESLVPRRTTFEQAHAAGLAMTAVVHPHFVDSGLTRAILRGGQRIVAEGLEHTLVAAARASRGDQPAIVYCHHGDVDTAGHAHGPNTEDWRSALRTVDAAVRATVAALDDDTVLIVTADHGMVAVAPDDVRELDGREDLLADVDVVAGEPRMRTLRLREGADPVAVAARWREAFGDDATVLTSAEAIAAGWFGPTVPPEHADRLGDVIVASHRGSLVHAHVDPFGGRLAGMHGSITREELEVPLIAIRGGTT
jgi:hypothetical protein